jgi:uncharacterized protein
MFLFPVTAKLTAIFLLFYAALSLAVIKRRFAARVSLGEGGDQILHRRIRVHGNFAEYIPFALIAFALLEAGGASPSALWGLGGVLILGRALHAAGILKNIFRARVTGMILTLAVLVTSAGMLFLK